MIQDLLVEFNSFFKGDAEVIIANNTVEITVGSRTLIVSLPTVVGVDSMGQSQQS